MGYKPAKPVNEDASGIVVYKGPFRSVIDDGGREYRRGERVPEDALTRAFLERGPIADQFVFLRD